MLNRIKSIWANRYLTPVSKPAESMYSISRAAAVNFFRDAPSPAFFKRAALGVGGLTLFGAAMAFLPFGLSAGAIVALTLLQIPISVFERSIQDSAASFIKKLPRNFSTLSASLAEHKKPLIAGALCTAALGAAAVMFPAAPLAAARLATPLLKPPLIFLKKSSVNLAVTLFKYPLKTFKRKTVSKIKKGYAPLPTGMSEGGAADPQNIIRAISALPVAQQHEVLRGIGAEFDAAAGHCSHCALPAAPAPAPKSPVTPAPSPFQ